MHANRWILTLSAFMVMSACERSDDYDSLPNQFADGGQFAAEAGIDECLYEGQVYNTGDVFCASDGCNSCQCNPEGTKGVGCSLKDCNAAVVEIAEVCK